MQTTVAHISQTEVYQNYDERESEQEVELENEDLRGSDDETNGTGSEDELESGPKEAEADDGEFESYNLQTKVVQLTWTIINLRTIRHQLATFYLLNKNCAFCYFFLTLKAKKN